MKGAARRQYVQRVLVHKYVLGGGGIEGNSFYFSFSVFWIFYNKHIILMYVEGKQNYATPKRTTLA